MAGASGFGRRGGEAAGKSMCVHVLCKYMLAQEIRAQDDVIRVCVPSGVLLC